MNDADRHPGAQVMGAFVDGTLAPAEVAQVSRHLVGCEDCRSIVAGAAQFRREEQELAAAPRKRTVWIAAAAVTAVAIGGSLLWQRREPSLIERMAEAAPRHHRLVPARLSGFPWAELQAPSRGGTPADPGDLKLDGVAGAVLEETTDRIGADARHARGVALLLIRRPDESIAVLEEAARTSDDARAWNDLAAARHAIAIRDDRAAELPQALAAVESALQRDPRLAEGRFNRALILEQLGLHDAARKAWQAYLDLEPGSAWSVEARRHLARLGGGVRRFEPKLLEELPPAVLVRDFAQETRAWGEGPMLAEWGDAVAAGDGARADATIARARTLGDALAHANGEWLLADAVGAIDRADAKTRLLLAEAHRGFRDARMAYARRRAQEAEKQFHHVADAFARGGSPMAAVAYYYAACAAFDQNRVDEARDALTQLLAGTRHRALSAQIEWQLAVCANAAGDWGASVRHADASAAAFRALGERTHAAFVDSIGAVALDLIGEPDLAWRRRILAFSELSAAGDVKRVGTILHSAAFTLAALGRNAAASALIQQRIDIAPANDPAALAFASAEAARFVLRDGNDDRAQRLLADARTFVGHVADAAIRERVTTQIELAQAASAAAIPSFDRAIASLAASEERAFLPDAYLRRARAHRAGGSVEAAASDYASGLAEVAEQREKLGDGAARLRFFDVAAQLIEDSIELQLTRGDAARAFAIADGARAVLDEVPVAAQTPRPMRAVAPGVILIEYAVLDRAVLAFRVTSTGMTAHRTSIDRAELQALVTSFAERIRRRAPLAQVDADAERLYELLVEPLGIGDARELVIVPDRELYALPFAALRNPRTRKYLVEEHTIRFAPSASFHRDEATDALAPALVVADPPSKGWPRLPASREEALQIGALHGATVLAGEAATRAAFFEAARDSALIHYSGHANSDASASYGALLLAAQGSDSGVVGSSDISRLRLERHPLVVLAACGTFRGDARHVAGMSGLSRAFLGAGARAVVGTLWEIDDDVSAPLFLRFHQRLRDGAAPARALRDAQLELLHSSDERLAHPAAWSPVELLGTT
jgi:CHAT domain-containing protein